MTRAHQFHSRKGNTPHLEDLLRHAYDRLDSDDCYQPDEVTCSLQHVYNSTYWFRPQSPAHQQGPSMLTEAHQHIVLTAAYPQVYHLFRPCAL